MTDGIARVASASAVVEKFLGWIPCLALQLSRRSILTEETLHRLRQQLAQMGLDLMPHTPLRFGIQAKLLKVLALSAILRCNDPELEGSWWHRKISPEIEQRVAVRYQLQRPARPWRTMSGKAFRPDQLRVAFPRNAFGSVLPLLAQHGLSFYRHTVTTTSHHDYGYNIQGLRLQVTTLFCVFFGFELCLRASLATPLAPDDEDQNTDEIPG